MPPWSFSGQLCAYSGSVLFSDRADNGGHSQKQEFAVQEDHGGNANMLLFLAIGVHAANMYMCDAGAGLNIGVLLFCCKSLCCVCMSGM